MAESHHSSDRGARKWGRFEGRATLRPRERGRGIFVDLGEAKVPPGLAHMSHQGAEGQLCCRSGEPVGTAPSLLSLGMVKALLSIGHIKYPIA